MNKELTASDIFTPNEAMRALLIIGNTPMHKAKDSIKKKIVEPIMPRINKVTGQENNADYFSYMLIDIVAQLEKANHA